MIGVGDGRIPARVELGRCEAAKFGQDAGVTSAPPLPPSPSPCPQCSTRGDEGPGGWAWCVRCETGWRSLPAPGPGHVTPLAPNPFLAGWWRGGVRRTLGWTWPAPRATWTAQVGYGLGRCMGSGGGYARQVAELEAKDGTRILIAAADLAARVELFAALGAQPVGLAWRGDAGEAPSGSVLHPLALERMHTLGAPADAVLLDHALEATPDPRRTLGSAWDLTRGGGTLAVVAWDASPSMLEHAPTDAGRVWSRKGLRALLRASHWDVVRTRAHAGHEVVLRAKRRA